MEYRLLGLSGCAVSALALGTLTFGNEASEADSFAQLDRFISAGGTLIDTADVYADGRSEQIIGRWLASRAEARERAVIATKGRFPTSQDPNGHGLSRRHLAAALDASLRRLGVEAHLERNWQVIDAVRKVAGGRGASMSQVAIAWVLARPAVRSVILGARTLAQLDDNLAAGDLDLSQDETRLLDEASDPGAPDYPYGERGQTQRDRRISGGRF
jgi:aryl-alcohol dehydrogenase-like predicted oxidoreductase